jgi:hypothetical protein
MRYANESPPPAERLEIMDEHLIDSFEFWGIEHVFCVFGIRQGVARRQSRRPRLDVLFFCGKS